MPMMKSMRRNTKIILWVVVAAFVVGFVFIQMGTGGMKFGRAQQALSRGIIAQINGQEITDQFYQEYLRRAVDAARKQTGREDIESDPGTMKEIESQAWKAMVNDVLLTQEIRKRGIQVTDQEIVALIRSNPPPQLLADTVFQTNGQFDLRKYQQALQDPRNLSFFSEYELTLREEFPKEKLRQALVAGVVVTDEEARRAFEDQNEKARVSYVYLDPSRFAGSADPAVSSEEMRAYYEKHKWEYHVGERANFRVAAFVKAPRPSDEAEGRKKVEDLLARVQAGEDFGKLAQEASEDTMSGRQGGVLNWVGRGMMVKPFEDAAFALRPGEVSGPVKTDFGWHLIRCDSARKDSVFLRHILIRVRPSEESLQELKGRAEQFQKEGGGQKFVEKAVGLGARVDSGEIFANSTYVPGVGSSSEAKGFCLEARPGSLSGVLETPEAFTVLQVKEHNKEGYRSLAEVEQQIRPKLIQEKRIALTLQKASDLKKEVASGKSLEQVAQENGLEVHKTDPFSPGDYVPQVGIRNEFVGVAFRATPGQVTGPVATDQGVFFLRVDERTPFDEQKFAAQRDSLKGVLFQEKSQQAFNEWFGGVRNRAKIRDFRGVMGGEG
jgi:peptidyl-prolyl cis-trans isomerase D